MEFTERELALIMVALDNTANSIRDTEVDVLGALMRRRAEAADMDTLWNRVHQERLCLLGEE